tara:strand:- start:13 stop:252 length:240 start_codon:yes stop_codon:yes gene_type:complete
LICVAFGVGGAAIFGIAGTINGTVATIGTIEVTGAEGRFIAIPVKWVACVTHRTLRIRIAVTLAVTDAVETTVLADQAF